MRFASAVVIAAGCYAPVPATGIPCAANGECPVPLVCDHARAVPTCERTVSDAGPTEAGDIDAPIDSPLLVDAPIDAALGPCLADNFNDGNANGWTVVDPVWTVRANEGPDNSFAYIASGANSDQIVTHPGLRGVRRARLALDFRIDNGVSGDFNIYLVPPGWTDPNSAAQPRYSMVIYVLGGDSGPNDRITRVIPPAPAVELATHVVSVAAGGWHHLELRYLPDGAIQVDLDGAAYMASPADSALPGPLDLVIRFWAQGAIDNVQLDCLR